MDSKMTNDLAINGSVAAVTPVPGAQQHVGAGQVQPASAHVPERPETAVMSPADLSEDLSASLAAVEKLVNSVVGNDVTFSVDQDLNRTVVIVREVGSDEVIRQFPPDEFITVAKFIADQNPDALDQDYLKGLLFDQYT